MLQDSQSPSLNSLALNHYGQLGVPQAIDPIIIGQINKTYIVSTDQTKYILQELSPIFNVAVMDDAWVIAHHVQKKGLLAPTLLKTDSNGLYCTDQGRVFRALVFIEGKSFRAITRPLMAQSAAVALAEFHRALLDLNYDYKSKRRHGGDYPFHSQNLNLALNNHPSHDYVKKLAPLAETFITTMERLTKNLITTPRHAHGDPKISNLLFDEHDQARAWVDYDTLGKTGWSLEMADALRSWCNPYPEDVLDAHVDMSIAEAALKGYGSIMKGVFSKAEAMELLLHCQAITLCLTMRYAADTLNENYFLHDKDRFSRAADHNWLKTNSMYHLFLDFERKSLELKTMISDYLL